MTYSSSSTFTITNGGTADLDVVSLTLAGSNPLDFEIGGSAAGILIPGATASFSVRADPRAVGTRTATLQIVSSDADESTFSLPLSVNGIGEF